MSRLSKLIEKRAKELMPFGIELATVVEPPPSLKIRVDNMNIILEKDDLIVCEHLLEHQRSYTTSPDIAGSDVSEWSDDDSPTHLHSHQVNSLTINEQTMTLHTKLTKGTRIAVMALPGAQQYLIWDKAVEMGG